MIRQIMQLFDGLSLRFNRADLEGFCNAKAMVIKQMKLVTRDVDPDSTRDLLERVPRACLSFASDHGPIVQPVGLQWQDGRYLVSFPGNNSYQPLPGQEVVLLVDEGIYYFDLRAIYIRGQVRTMDAPPDATAGRKWFEVVPIKTVAWDYGTLREVSHDR